MTGDDTRNRDPATDLTHVSADGEAQMVDVGEKADSRRRAVASGSIRLTSVTIESVRSDDIAKGDVLSTARLGAIQAVKHTWEAIPLCHQIPITNVDVTTDITDETIRMQVAVETVGKTGCEMEALHGVTTGLNVVWDMVKAVEKNDDGQYPETAIQDVRVEDKVVER